MTNPERADYFDREAEKLETAELLISAGIYRERATELRIHIIEIAEEK